MTNKKLDLQEIHSAEVEILDFVVDICTKNNLKYCLFYGTLLGAVRHKGFIPWDDDIDIVMPKNDYDKLIEIGKDIKHPYFKIIESKYTKDILFNGIKVVDTRFKVKEWVAKENPVYGLFVDVFPMMNYRQGIVSRKKMKFLFNLRWAACQKRFVKSSRNHNVLKFIGFLLFRFVNPYTFVKKIDKQANKYSLVQENGKLTDPFNYNGLYIFDSTIFSNTIMATFEKKEYCIPKNYDCVLKQLYGNYVEVPPLKLRNNHYLDVWRNK